MQSWIRKRCPDQYLAHPLHNDFHHLYLLLTTLHRQVFNIWLNVHSYLLINRSSSGTVSWRECRADSWYALCSLTYCSSVCASWASFATSANMSAARASRAASTRVPASSNSSLAELSFVGFSSFWRSKCYNKHPYQTMIVAVTLFMDLSFYHQLWVSCFIMW